MKTSTVHPCKIKSGTPDPSSLMLAALFEKHNSPQLVRGISLRKYPVAGVGSRGTFPRRPHPHTGKSHSPCRFS